MELLFTAAAFMLSMYLMVVELLEATTYSLEHAGWGPLSNFSLWVRMDNRFLWRLKLACLSHFCIDRN